MLDGVGAKSCRYTGDTAGKHAPDVKVVGVQTVRHWLMLPRLHYDGLPLHPIPSAGAQSQSQTAVPSSSSPK